MFSTLMERVQTIAPPAGVDDPPAARYYDEQRSGKAGGSRGVAPLD
jgi:hypothetical protein